MKTTDCLCRKALGWLRENGYQIVAMTSMLLAGYFLHPALEKHQPPPTVEIEMVDKDDKIISRYSIQEIKEKESLEISAPTDVWPENPTWALMKVHKEDIKHAQRVVVRLK